MQRSTRVRRRYTPAQRAKILAAYQRSQLPQKDFSAQAGIGHSTLMLWLRQAAAKDSAAFVPVPNLLSAASTSPAYRLQFPQGVIVEVAPGFQAEELGTLLKQVQAL
ncbi:MAG TPA: transposase [Anaerolineales bacterium]